MAMIRLSKKKRWSFRWGWVSLNPSGSPVFKTLFCSLPACMLTTLTFKGVHPLSEELLDAPWSK